MSFGTPKTDKDYNQPNSIFFVSCRDVVYVEWNISCIYSPKCYYGHLFIGLYVPYLHIIFFVSGIAIKKN